MNETDEKDTTETQEGPSAEELLKEKEALLAKRDELLGETKREREKRRELESEVQKLREAQQEAEKTELEKAGEWEKLREKLESEWQTKLREREEALEKERQQNYSYLVNTGLTDALVQAGVAKEFMPAARALIKERGIELAENDGERFAQIEGKRLAEWVTEWAKSDEGSPFIAARQNAGAGSAPPKTGSADSQDWGKMSRKEKAQALLYRRG